MKNKKLAVLKSVIALLLCVSMLAGTTFAWFTDGVRSGKNVIVAGNLDVELEYLTAQGEWAPVNGDTNVFAENTLWEPGHTEVVYLRVSNAGSLALKYQLGINVASESASVNVSGERFLLSDYIEFAAIEGVETAYADRAAARAAVQDAKILSTGYTKDGQLESGDPADYVAFVVYMPETVTNEANYKTGYAAPEIQLGINLLATQQMQESDSFDSEYDKDSEYPVTNFNFSAGEPILGKDEAGQLTESMSVGGAEDLVQAEIPTGVKVADDVQNLTLNVQTLPSTDANITIQENELARPMEVHIDGVAEDNTVPMLVTLKGAATIGLNASNVTLFHMENGAAVTMTPVALGEVDAHNEYYYDPATGDITMAVASFSEFIVLEQPLNPWKGGVDYTWYNTTATEFTLINGDQLAGFRNIVDGKAEGFAADTFEGKTVRLGKDIELGNSGADPVSFDPIGYGYESDADGRVFKGTFDGQDNTICNLYQNGWDLGLTYSTAGGGLFASVVDAQIKNLNMDGAEIVMECIDMGTVVGYAYGTCKFENIVISDCIVANYNRYTGGVVGEVNGTHTFDNIWVDSNTTISALWGTFDPSVGGIVGGKYGDATVSMKNCTVACVLDVYNDVTSAYQWFAYRRCGMLIGNTEESAKNENGSTVATASFLTCENCVVKYGDWNRYTYCQFANEENPGKNYPWVRVQEGLHNEAYSNPRYGHPLDANGNAVTNADHKHQTGDQCTVSVPFDQLYGGGQGVYGATTHAGVRIEDYKYTISYMFNRKLMAVTYITDNSVQQSTNHAQLEQELTDSVAGGYTFRAWVNAGSNDVPTVAAGNTKNIVLYASWNGIHTARFVDQFGNVIYEETFATGATQLKNIPEAPAVDGCIGSWEAYTLGNEDITIYPVYAVDNGKLSAEAVDEDGDGVTDYYRINAVNELGANVTIPGYINGIPCKVVTDLSGNLAGEVESIVIQEGVETINADAFAWTPSLKEVSIPSSVTSIGSGTFADPTWSGIAGIVGYSKVVAITYAGTWEQWLDVCDNGWDGGLGRGSTVTCTDGTYAKTAGAWSTGEGNWQKQQ